MEQGATDQIEQSLRDLSIIFNCTQDALALIRVDGEKFYYIRNNLSHQRLTGYDGDALVGKTPTEIFGPIAGQTLEKHCRKCLQTKTPLTYEGTASFLAGKKTCLVSISPVMEAGKVLYLVVSRTDISKLKEAEAKISGLLAQFEALFCGHRAAMLLVEPEKGKIIDANPSALDFFGYCKKEMLQLTTEDIHMRPAEEIKKLRVRALEEKQKYSLCPFKLKNGEIRLTDVYVSPITHNKKKLLFLIIFDVMDREQYRKELYLERELLKTTLLSIGDGLVTTDSQGLITAMNPAAEKLSGWLQEEAKGQSFQRILPLINKKSSKPAEDLIVAALESGKTMSLANHTLLRNKEGRKIPVVYRAAPIKDPRGKMHGAVMVVRDVTEEKQYQAKIIRLGQRDFLTGLYNRRFIRQQLGDFKAGACHLPLALIMADINGLRLVNAIFGHQRGDYVLKQVARILKDNCRREDVIARWGGDEFLLLLPQTNAASARKIIKRIEAAVSATKGPIGNISISLGFTIKEEKNESFDQALVRAEKNMYRHKLLMDKSHHNTFINAILATLSEKSQETKQHCNRLKEYTVALGTKLQLSARELDELELLALLHDIGKIGVDTNILNKPGLLDTDEWKEIKRHPEIGYRIAINIPELSQVAEYILYHHERWDGSGYPQGLKGEEIPLLCRILALADAYDAMTTDRPYRKAMSPSRALVEIKRKAGTQFDPELAALFVEIVASGI